MSAPEQDFSIVPGQPVDQAWERLEAQFELSGGFWLGFVFTAAPQAVDALRTRRNKLFEMRDLKWRDYRPGNPDSLSETLIWLLRSPEPTEVDCVWVESIRSDSPGAKEKPWTQAWEQLFLRSNEHRDALRARLRGGLVFAAPLSIMPLVREAAPDLWSVRSIVINVEMAPSLRVPEPVPSFPPRPSATEIDRKSPKRFAPGASTPPSVDIDVPPPPAPTAPPISFRHHLPPPPPQVARLAFTHADRQFVESLIAAGQFAAAEARIRGALEAFGSDEVVEKAFVYQLLARVGEAKGDVVAARRSIEEAIAIYTNITPNQVPIDWFDMAKRLAWADGDIVAATMHSVSAIEQCRRRVRIKEGIDGLRDLALALKTHGEHVRNTGNVMAAHEAFDEAVLVCRRLADLGDDDPRDLLRLSDSLLSLGDSRTHRGDFAGAVATFEESVKVNRKMCTRAGDTVFALRSLSVSLTRLGHLRQETGDFEGARQAFDEALTIRRRIFDEKDAQGFRDLASVLARIGLLHLATGEVEAAIASLHESVSFDRKWGQLVPESIEACYHLAFVLHYLGDAYEKRGNGEAARLALEEAMECARQIAQVSQVFPNAQLLLESTETAVARLMTAAIPRPLR